MERAGQIYSYTVLADPVEELRMSTMGISNMIEFAPDKFRTYRTLSNPPSLHMIAPLATAETDFHLRGLIVTCVIGTM